METRTASDCHDCGATPGSFHTPGCDVETCPNCGCQAISCDCTDEQATAYPRLPYTGEFPGMEAARRLGLWCVRAARGWRQCRPDTPGASEDLNRLVGTCRWDQDLARWEMPEGPATTKMGPETMTVVRLEGPMTVEVGDVIVVRDGGFLRPACVGETFPAGTFVCRPGEA